MFAASRQHKPTGAVFQCDCILAEPLPCHRWLRDLDIHKDGAVVCNRGHRVCDFCIHLWVIQNDDDLRTMKVPCGCAMIEVLETRIWEDAVESLGYETKREGGKVHVTRKKV
jgi:hypothetical protein